MMSVDSDYGSGGSGLSSPCPAVTTQVPQQLASVLYYLVVPPGYHLEFTTIEQRLTEPAPPVVLPTKTLADEPRMTKSSTFQRRLIKWSLPPPPVHSVNLPGWSPTP